MSGKKIKFFTGAPHSSNLNWQENQLLKSFTSAFQVYLGLSTEPAPTQIPSLLSAPIANWRILPDGTNPFYATPVLREEPREEYHSPFRDNHDDFLSHSFAVLNDLKSSQIAPNDDSVDEDEVTFLTSNSFTTESPISESGFSSFDSTATRTQGKQLMTVSGPIASIKSLPSAAQLIALRPQTITRNLIVGIIAIAPAKTVTVRRGNYEMDIVEMTVGDETKAGFTISTWLSPEITNQSAVVRDMRRALQRLKTGDVVVIERLALSVFRDQVFGQSLNWRTTKNVTRFSVVDRDAIEQARAASASQAVASSIVDKVQRVRDWVDSFIGPSRKRQLEDDYVRKGRKVARVTEREEEYLPPDTQ
ncbi:hypothetical protein MBLNU457_6744t1 [Dothideomycetes sp. NU457]